MKRVIFDVAALIARVVVGVIFVAHGLQKWTQGLGATSAGFTEMGVPLPGVAAAFATILEVVGGVLLILGLAVRVVALLLLIDMIGAIVFVHGANGVFVQDSGWELAAALGVACLLLAALGGGRIGLDAIVHSVFRHRRAGDHETAVARPAERPRDVPRQGRGPGGLDDRDRREVDSLLSDDPTQPNPHKR